MTNITNQATVRYPNEQDIAIVKDNSLPLPQRWDALQRMDGFLPTDYPYQSMPQTYVISELARAEKLL
jgi:hypothetical protein